MCRVRGVAHEHEIVAGTHWRLFTRRNVGPWRRQMTGVRLQAMSREPGREQPLAGGDGAVRVEPIEPRACPRRFIALDDERRKALIEAIAVRLKNTVRILDEVEREGLERQGWCPATRNAPGRLSRRSESGRRAGCARRC